MYIMYLFRVREYKYKEISTHLFLTATIVYKDMIVCSARIAYKTSKWEILEICKVAIGFSPFFMSVVITIYGEGTISLNLFSREKIKNKKSYHYFV